MSLKRTDIETRKTLENLAGHIQVSQREEPVSAANNYTALCFTFF